MADYIGICSNCGAERNTSPCPECGSNARIEYIRTDEPKLTDQKGKKTPKRNHNHGRKQTRGHTQAL